MLAILGGVLLGTFVTKPLDYGFNYEQVEQVSTQQEQPLLEGKATRYDYRLNGNRWSKTHNTCAIRKKERYGNYKVCSKTTGKCVVCRHNDYGPQREDRVIDLSSHAFKELGVPLSRGVTEVLVYKVD